MAARKFTTKARPGRNPLASPATEKPASASADKATLKTAIEAERRRLQKVHSLLGCIAVAFDYDDCASCEIDYADVIDIVRSLVCESVTRLDFAILRSRPAEE